MISVTEIDILVAAREQIKKGYTNEAFVGVSNDFVEHMSTKEELEDSLKDPAHYVVVCAVGGVEHALYKLCDSFITDDIREKWYEIGTPFGIAEHNLAKLKNEKIALYAKCLLRLNKIARNLGYTSVEDPNVNMNPDESKPIVLDIYRRAIRQARDEQRKISA